MAWMRSWTSPELSAAEPLLRRVELMVRALVLGSMTEGTARGLVSQERWALTDEVVHGVVAYSRLLFGSDEPRSAWGLAAVLLAIVESDQLFRQWWREAAQCFVMMSIDLLTEDLDERLYDRASNVADELVALNRREGDSNALSLALILSAELRHDPYALGPYSFSELLDPAVFHARKWIRLGWETSDIVDKPSLMPHPREAATRALQDAREAFDTVPSKVAIATAARVMVSVKELGEEIDASLIADIAASGLKGLDAALAPDMYLFLVRALQMAGKHL